MRACIVILQHQELYDYTIKSLSSAKYRFPTIVLGDGCGQNEGSGDLRSLCRVAIWLQNPLSVGSMVSSECFQRRRELAKRNLADYSRAVPELLEYEFWGQPGAGSVVATRDVAGRQAVKLRARVKILIRQ